MDNVRDRPKRRPQGIITRGTTAPNRLRRVDRWVIACYRQLLLSAEAAPLVLDLGFGAYPVTTVELYERLCRIRPDVEVVGLEIDPERVQKAEQFLEDRGGQERYPRLRFNLGGFELPVPRAPLIVRAFNVLRQYEEEQAWQAWEQLCRRLAPGGILVEGTCDEIGRRAVWVTLTHALSRPEPRTITFAAHLPSLPRPSELAERLPKTLIHRNVPGEPIHEFLAAFDRAWATAAPFSVFGPRQRWIAAAEHLAKTWPVYAHPPFGGRRRWRLGEVSLPWAAVAPVAARLPSPRPSPAHSN